MADRISEIPPEKQLAWIKEKAADFEYGEKSAVAMSEGRMAMDDLLEMEGKELLSPPSEETLEKIHYIGNTQSARETTRFLTKMLGRSPVHEETIAEMIGTLTTIVGNRSRRQPMPVDLGNLFIEIDQYLIDPKSKNNGVADAYVELVKALIHDPGQTCIGFRNKSGPRGILGKELETLEKNIEEKNIPAITKKFVNHFQMDSAFADDKMVREAHEKFNDLGEEISENPSFESPVSDALFAKTRKAFLAVEAGKIGLKQRRTIKKFYDTIASKS